MKEALEARPPPNRRVPCRATASLCPPRPEGSAPTSTTENIKKMAKFACSWKTWDVGSRVQDPEPLILRRCFNQQVKGGEPHARPELSHRSAQGALCWTPHWWVIRGHSMLVTSRPFIFISPAHSREMFLVTDYRCAAAAVHRNTMLGLKQHVTDQEQLVGC